jgi:hypothetical protein
MAVSHLGQDSHRLEESRKWHEHVGVVHTGCVTQALARSHFVSQPHAQHLLPHLKPPSDMALSIPTLRIRCADRPLTAGGRKSFRRNVAHVGPASARLAPSSPHCDSILHSLSKKDRVVTHHIVSYETQEVRSTPPVGCRLQKTCPQLTVDADRAACFPVESLCSSYLSLSGGMFSSPRSIHLVLSSAPSQQMPSQDEHANDVKYTFSNDAASLLPLQHVIHECSVQLLDILFFCMKSTQQKSAPLLCSIQ